MNQIEIGKFIAKCRREKKLTQAQLAEKLNITDRAVSKWETGKSMPDSSIMLELCEILGITVNELLCGEVVAMEHYEKKADENLLALKKKTENSRLANRVVFILFSAALFIAVMVCLICNLAISGTLTWSLIPVSSIAFAWAITFPGIISGRKGILLSLSALSILIVPYLLLLSRLTKVREVFTIGSAIAVISIVFLWITAAVFIRIGKTNKPAALGITFLTAIPLVFLINLTLSKMIAEPIFDVWDLLTVFLLFLSASAAFIYDRLRKTKHSQQH